MDIINRYIYSDYIIYQLFFIAAKTENASVESDGKEIVASIVQFWHEFQTNKMLKSIAFIVALFAVRFKCFYAQIGIFLKYLQKGQSQKKST